MDCLEAQQVLSAALDHEVMPPELLAEARSHCHECAECARFVQGLAALQRAHPPAPAQSVHARVMAAVEARRMADAVDAWAADLGAAAHSSAIPAGTPQPELQVKGVSGSGAETGAPGTATTIDVAKLPLARFGNARRLARQRNALVWAGAAAAVLIVAGFAAVYGVRNIVSPTATSSRSALPTGESATDKGLSSSPPGGYDSLQSQGGTTGSTPSPTRSGDFLTVNEIVYRSAGTLVIDRSQLTTAGTTSSALGTGGTAQTVAVYSTPTPGQIALMSGSQTLAFQIVTRRFGSNVYALTSKPITAFGVWPSLPAGFIEPTTADGAPTFVAASKDELGVQLYSRPGVALTDGFAIAPGTAESDPAQGNPNWTWWTRTR